MFNYLQCTCGKTSGLLLDSELREIQENPEPPRCACGVSGWMFITVKQTFAFYFACQACPGQWSLLSQSDYSLTKQVRPRCPKCGENNQTFFVPPNLGEAPKWEKRKSIGILDPKQHDIDMLGRVDLKGLRAPLTKRKRLDDPRESIKPVTDDTVRKLSEMERDYKRVRRVQKRFPAMDPESDPQKTSQMTVGRLVPLSTYTTELTSSVIVKATTFTRQMKSAPTIVTDVRIIPRDREWDYRELGPCSFLRRLCSLLYVIHFGAPDESSAHAKGTAEYKAAKKKFNASKDKFNPVEVQAMWAAGSLYIAANNVLYSQELLKALGTRTTVRKLVKKIGRTYPTVGRNFTPEMLRRMKTYQAAIETNTEESYRTYFLSRWTYVFKQMRDAMACTAISSVTIQRNKQTRGETDYTRWTVARGCTLKAGKVFVVLPDSGTKTSGKFETKGVHAEQLYYPILMALDVAGRLTAREPAWISGVKLPCYTCAMVVRAAANELKDKLVVATNAFGTYWEQSGQHVTRQDFDQTQTDGTGPTFTFSNNPTSINLFDTEFPMSPEHSPIWDEES